MARFLTRSNQGGSVAKSALNRLARRAAREGARIAAAALKRKESLAKSFREAMVRIARAKKFKVKCDLIACGLGSFSDCYPFEDGSVSIGESRRAIAEAKAYLKARARASDRGIVQQGFSFAKARPLKGVDGEMPVPDDVNVPYRRKKGEPGLGAGVAAACKLAVMTVRGVSNLPSMMKSVADTSSSVNEVLTDVGVS